MATDVEAKHFKLLGGQPSLDFVNTVGAWVTDPGNKSRRDYKDAVVREKLMNYADLAAWSRYAGLLTEKDVKQLLRTAEKQPGAASAVIKRGLKLRETLYRLFKCIVENWRPDPEDIERLNEELSIARGRQSLVSTGNKLEWKWDDSGEALDRVLWPLVLSGAELLSSGDLSRLRQCSGEECGWLFLDTSRNRSRQWCEMRDCGNLAKVRRFRRRQAEADPGWS
jgi:predicted RNA-binding Zn ribbon-like protein